MALTMPTAGAQGAEPQWLLTTLRTRRRQDEGKLQQLNLAIEKLTQQVAAQKAALEAEITDTQVRPDTRPASLKHAAQSCKCSSTCVGC